MTAEASRLDAIEAREVAASAEIARLCEGNPGANWRWSIPANPERDSDLILSAPVADVPYLLALARKQQAALAKVELACEAMDAGVQMRAGDPRTKSFAAQAIRAAIREALEATL